MTREQIERMKWLGLFLMIIDHAARVITFAFPEPYGALGVLLGRSGMPLFSAALGYTLITAQAKRLELRLLLMAIAMQPLFVWAFHVPWYNLNIFFTLVCGTAITLSIKNRRFSPYLGVLPLLHWVDYGLVGVLLVPVWYLWGTKQMRWLTGISLAGGILLLNPDLFGLTGVLLFPLWFSAAYFIPVKLPQIKHFFYYAYAGHLLVLVTIRYLFG